MTKGPMVEDMTVDVEHHFDAPAEQVFALLTDVEPMAGLGPEHESAAWLDDRRFTEQEPAGADGYIAAQAENLRTGMAKVLHEAASLLEG